MWWQVEGLCKAWGQTIVTGLNPQETRMHVYGSCALIHDLAQVFVR